MHSSVTFLFAYLCFYLLGRISEKEGGIRVTRTHFRLRTLQGWKEDRMQQCRFRVTDSRGHISRHSKIGILKQQAGTALNANKQTMTMPHQKRKRRDQQEEEKNMKNYSTQFLTELFLKPNVLNFASGSCV